MTHHSGLRAAHAGAEARRSEIVLAALPAQFGDQLLSCAFQGGPPAFTRAPGFAGETPPELADRRQGKLCQRIVRKRDNEVPQLAMGKPVDLFEQAATIGFVLMLCWWLGPGRKLLGIAGDLSLGRSCGRYLRLGRGSTEEVSLAFVAVPLA